MKPSCVYFLGAGASKEAGVPTTDVLLEEILTRLKQSKKRPRLREFCRTFDLGPNREGQRPAVVEAISLIDTCIRDERPLSRKLDLEALEKIRGELIFEISKEIGRARPSKSDLLRIPRDAKTQTRGRKLYVARYQKRFAQMLRPRPRLEASPLLQADSIITTNYDTTLDRALYELVYWQASTGDKDFSPFWDVFLGSNFRDPDDDSDALEDRESTIDLLKLHGSVNWLYCPRCSRIFVAAFTNSVEYLIDGPLRETRCHCEYKPLEPVLIAPSSRQEIVNPHLQSIWMNAYHVLESSGRWVFVGYSLPEEDLAVRALLFRAKDSRIMRGLKSPQIHVISVTDAPDIAERFHRLLKVRPTWNDRGFERYIDRRWATGRHPAMAQKHNLEHVERVFRKSELRLEARDQSWE